MAETFGYICTVNEAGAASDGSEGPNPVVYINLTDRNGSFSNNWFYVEELAKKEILAVALAALTGRRHVTAAIEPPNAANSPYTQIFRLYLRSS
jgi:hypothetical protein